MDLNLIAKDVNRKTATAASSSSENDVVTTDNTNTSDQSTPMMNRLILFDDRTKNFTPQNGENGVHVIPYEIKDVFTSENSDKASGIKTTSLPVSFLFQEGKEVGRFAVISILALLASDVRSILPYFRSTEHNKRFPPQK